MDVNIISTSVLNARQKKAICHLENMIQINDNVCRNVYLSNHFNQNKNMPAFFLAYDGDKLIGVLTVYSDEVPKCEVTLFVHPKYRNIGVGTQLKRNAIKCINDYGVTDVTYIVEKIFMENNKELTKKWQYNNEHSELLLELVNFSKINCRNDVNVRMANQQEINEIAEIWAKAFKSSIELGIQYVKQALNDRKVEQWTIRLANRIVGTLSIDTNTNVDFYFGVAIHPEYQKQGIGKAALNTILFNRHFEKKQQLQVTLTNVAAINLYKSNGFKEISEIRYVKE